MDFHEFRLLLTKRKINILLINRLYKPECQYSSIQVLPYEKGKCRGNDKMLIIIQLQ